MRRRITQIVLLSLWAATACGSCAAPAKGEIVIHNPGFELEQAMTQSPAGWRVTGTPGAAFPAEGGASGGWQFTQRSAEPYKVEAP